jgi:putative membrane protein
MNTNYRNTRRFLFYLTVVVGQLALCSAYAADTTENPGQFSAADYKFAKAAASGGIMEVTLGKLAAEKSVSPPIQQFGQRMVTDHGKAGQALGQIASRKGAVLPSQPTASQQKEIGRLAKLSGHEFDKAYITLMVKDHKTDAKEFRRASENVQDPDLKAFAAATLLIVQEHLKVAEDLDESTRHSISMNK